MTDSTPKTVALRALSLALGLALVLAGCSSEPSKNADKQAQSPVLQMLWWGNASEEAALHTELDRIAESGGSKVQVEVIGTEPDDAEISRRLRDGQRPDIIRTNDPQKFGEQGVEVQLDDGFWPQTTLARQRDGKDIAAPYDVTTTTTWINTDAFAKAGVQAPSTTLPWTSWGQLLHDADTVRQRTGMEFALAIEDDPRTVVSVVSSFGTSAFGKDQQSVNWKKESVAEALEMIKNGVGAGLIADKPFSTTTSAKDIFNSSQAAVYVGPGRFVANQEAKLVANPCEQSCGGLPSASYLMAFSDSGKDIVEQLTSPEADLKRAEATGELPAHTGVTFAEPNPRATELEKSNEELIASGMSPAITRLDGGFVEPLSAYLDGKTATEDVVETMAKALEAAGNRG